MAIATADQLLPAFACLRSNRARVDFVYALEATRDLAPGDCFARKDDCRAMSVLEQANLLVDTTNDESLALALTKYSEAVRLASPAGRALARAFCARARALQRQDLFAEAASDAARGAQLWAAVTSAAAAEATDSALQTAAADARDALAAAYCEANCWAAGKRLAHAQDAFRRAADFLVEAPLAAEEKTRAAAEIASSLRDFEEQEQKKKRSAKEQKRKVKVKESENQCQLLPQKPDFGNNASLPSASNALLPAWSNTRGRHLIAKKDIPLGSALIVERPYAWSLSSEMMNRRCLHCFCDLQVPLPCHHCSTVSYCSTMCRDIAWKTYHFHECRILNHLLLSKQLSKMSLLALRIVVTARIGGIMNATESPTSYPEKIVGVDTYSFDADIEEEGRDIKKPFLSHAYSSVYGQVTNVSSRPPGDLLKRAVTAVFMARCIRSCVANTEQERTVAAALLHHLQSCSCNAYQVAEHQVSGSDLVNAEEMEVGGAVYPTVSLVNHSCYPNVSRFSYGNACVVRACRWIRKDEQILDTYGPHFLMEARDERRAKLRTQYFFECMCEACAGRWPLATELRALPVQYTCKHCGALLGGRISSVRMCPHCRKKLDGKTIAKKVESATHAYATALDTLAQGSIDNCLRVVHTYICLLQPLVVPPNVELARWLQLYVHCLALSSNTRNIQRQ